MKLLDQLGHAVLALTQPAAAQVRRVAARPEPEDALVQAARLGLQAYTRASDAYTEGFMKPSVALWSVGIAAGIVLLEWLLARGRH